MSDNQKDGADSIFTMPVRTLTLDELQHVSGGDDYQDNFGGGNKSSALKIDASGYFQ